MARNRQNPAESDADDGTHELTALQAQAAALLAAGRGPSEVARDLKINRDTLHEWRQRAEFEAAYNAELAATLGALRDGLRAGQLSALALLREVVDDTTAGRRDRISAARVLLSAVALPDREPGPTTPAAVEDARWLSEAARRHVAALATMGNPFHTAEARAEFLEQGSRALPR